MIKKINFPKVPKGWRKLRKGENIIDGDKFRSSVGRGWVETMIGGERIKVDADALNDFYIRRVKEAK